MGLCFEANQDNFGRDLRLTKPHFLRGPVGFNV